MTRKDYEHAARIVQEMAVLHPSAWEPVEDAFVEFFQADNVRFNEDRFRRACVPGRNVRARA